MPLTLTDGTKLTFLGHSTFTLKTPGGKNLILDPWVENNPRCPEENKDVGPLDMMLITHGHYDHIQDAVAIGKETNAQAVCVFETAAWLGSKGLKNAAPMNKGGTLVQDGLKITMVHADHSCGITDGDQIVYGGEPGGYVITLENGYKIYHTGDTAVFGDMALIAHIYQPGPRPTAHRRPLRHVPAGSRPRLPLDERQTSHSDPLRHVPTAHRHTGSISGRAR